jgi:L-fuculose-phosphate aldolase
MCYDTINEDDIIVVKADGSVVESSRKPTIEMGLHLGIYRSRPDINAIVHTHPVYSQVFAVLREEIPPIIDEAAQIMGGSVRCAKYGLPGTDELANNCIDVLKESGYACLLANHGAVCIGSNMDMAFKVSAVLEMTAHIYLLARSIGKPVLFTKKEVDFMHDFAYHRYGQ